MEGRERLSGNRREEAGVLTEGQNRVVEAANQAESNDAGGGEPHCHAIAGGAAEGFNQRLVG